MLRWFLAIWCTICATKAVSGDSYVIGVEDSHYLPYFDSERERYFGFARDVLDKFASLEGISFTYKIYPIKRLFNAFLEQTVDFKFPDNPLWQSDLKKAKVGDTNAIVYSDEVAPFIDGVLVLPANLTLRLGAFREVTTLRGFTLSGYEKAIADKDLAVHESDDIGAVINQLLAKHIQGVYLNVAVAKNYLANTMKLPADSISFNPDLPHTKGSYLLSTIKHKALIAKFNKYLQDHAKELAVIKEFYRIKN